MSDHVGRVYLEDDHGYVGMARYAVPTYARAAEIAVYGRVWGQVRTVGEGVWVYRARPGASDVTTPGLVDLVAPQESGWVDPLDPWPVEVVPVDVVAPVAVEDPPVFAAVLLVVLVLVCLCLLGYAAWIGW